MQDCPYTQDALASKCPKDGDIRLVVMNEVEDHDSQPKQVDKLLAQWLLIGQWTQESFQRTSLFKTCCKSSGKVCNVIVDGGSIDNIFAKEMVQKLGLRRMINSYPYRIGWLRGEHAFEVREQYLVDF